MKNRSYIFSLLISVALLSTGCIKETFPKGSTITQEQLEQSGNAIPHMISGIPSAMTSSGAASFYGSYGYHYDFGISAIHFATEAMLEDIAILRELGYFWFNGWYQNLGQGYEYTSCAYFWYQYYKWIKLANDIIKIAKDSDDELDKDTKEILGQAYANRAMYYLDLARMYEPKESGILPIRDDIKGLTVPIVTEETTEEQAKNNPRAKREDMYKFILSDLKKAEEYLKDAPDAYTAPNITAVYGLYARAYLELGATYKEMGDPTDWDMTSQKAYKEAARYARKAIDMKQHKPLTQAQWEDPTNGFNNGAACEAWIWGIQTSSENQMNLVSNIAHRSCEALYGYACLCMLGVNKALYDRISDDDFRKHSWYDPESDYSYKFAGGGREQNGYLMYGQYGIEALKYLSLKFRPGSGETINYTVGNAADWCLMRIEEMYFIEMEAVAMSQSWSKGKELLSEFMTRYRYDSYEPVGVESESAFINEMLLQKRIEFWGEGILFYDYKRLDKGITRGYSGSNIPAIAQFNCERRSPQWNFVITRGEIQSNPIIETQNNPDPTGKLVKWEE